MHQNITIASRTDTGLERKENQDACGYWYDEASDTYLLIVADGMGGAACGAVASQLAVQVIYDRFFNIAERQLPCTERLARAICAANSVIHQQAEKERCCHGMGSTCVVLAVTPSHERAYLAHVGDSRIYLIRDNRIARLTKDHSRVQRMLDDGLITEEDAINHPDRNLLERSLGSRATVSPEVRPEPLGIRAGDLYVLCTDGLTALVRDEELFELARFNPPSLACEALIDLANERGGHDNITVQIMQIGE